TSRCPWSARRPSRATSIWPNPSWTASRRRRRSARCRSGKSRTEAGSGWRARDSGCGLLLPERGHHLAGEALALLEIPRLRGSDGWADVDDFEPGILVLDLLELLRDLLGRADQPRARLDRVAQGRQSGLTRALGVGDGLDLLGRQPRHEAERGEHLD